MASVSRDRRRVPLLTWPRALAISWGVLIATAWAAGRLYVADSWGSVVVDVFSAVASAMCLWAMGPAEPTARRTSVWSIVGLFALVWVFGQASSSWFISHVDDAAFAAYASNMSSFGLVGYLVVSVVVAPVSEELIFRGVTLRALRAGVGVRAALVVQALLFSLSHGTATHLVPTFLAGLLFGWVALRTGRLRGAVVAHMANNAVSLLLALYIEGFSSLLPIGVWLALSAALACVLVWSAKGRAAAVLSRAASRRLRPGDVASGSVEGGRSV